MKKKCSICKEVKAITEFNRDKSKKDGHSYRCRECQNAALREWRLNNLEHKTAYNKAWRDANPGYHAAKNREWRKANPDYAQRYWSEDIEGRRAYANAHKKVYRVKGKAADHTCDCGKAAEHWAYLHNDPNEQRTAKGIPYGAPEFYDAMCRDCHTKFDTEMRKNA